MVLRDNHYNYFDILCSIFFYVYMYFINSKMHIFSLFNISEVRMYLKLMMP